MVNENISSNIEVTTATEIENKFYEKLDNYKTEVRQELKENQAKTDKVISEIKQETKQETKRIEDGVNKQLDSITVELQNERAARINLAEALKQERLDRDRSRERRIKENEEFKKEISSKIEVLTAENYKLAHGLINHQNTTAEAINILHTRINIVEGQILLTNEQLAKVITQMEKLGQQTAEKFIKQEVLPDLSEEEITIIKQIMNGDKSDWETVLDSIISQTFSSIINNGITASLRGFEHYQQDKKLNTGQDYSLREAFCKSFTTDLLKFQGHDYKSILIEFTGKLVITTGIAIYKYAKARQEKQNMMRYWRDKTSEYKEDIKKYLRRDSDEYFNRLILSEQKRWHCDLGRDDATFDLSENNDFKLTFPEFNRLLKQKQNMGDDYILTLMPYTYYYSLFRENYINYSAPKEKFLKPDLTEEQKQDFHKKFILYSAYHQIGQFTENINNNITIKQNIVIGFFGGINGTILLNFRNKLIWNQNKIAIYNIMQNCIVNYNKNALDELIETRIKLVKIKVFINSVNSTTGKKYLEKMESKKYKGEMPDYYEIFDQALHFYQILEHKGITDRENYLHYSSSDLKLVKTSEHNLIISAIDNIETQLKTIAKEHNRTCETLKEIQNPDMSKTKITDKYADTGTNNTFLAFAGIAKELASASR